MGSQPRLKEGRPNLVCEFGVDLCIYGRLVYLRYTRVSSVDLWIWGRCVILEICGLLIDRLSYIQVTRFVSSRGQDGRP